MNTIVRFTCPVCSRPIETSPRLAQTGVECPDCKTGFIPETVEPVTEPEPSLVGVKPPPLTEAESLADIGGSFVKAGFWIFVLAVIASVLIVWGDAPHAATWIAIMLGGGISLTFMFAVIGHLLHIRALLERNVRR